MGYQHIFTEDIENVGEYFSTAVFITVKILWKKIFGMELVYQEFSENLKIKNAIFGKIIKFDMCNIYIYYLEKDIDTRKEKSLIFV